MACQNYTVYYIYYLCDFTVLSAVHVKRKGNEIAHEFFADAAALRKRAEPPVVQIHLIFQNKKVNVGPIG